jgi:hypothetical protein
MMTFSKLVAAGSLSLVGLVAGCSGGGPEASGVAESTKLYEMTEQDSAKLCDFSAAWLGGYGGSKECTINGQTSKSTVAKDRATCVAASRDAVAKLKGKEDRCNATIADYEILIRSDGSCATEPGYAEAYARVLACETAARSPNAGSTTTSAQGPALLRFSGE